MEAEEREPIFVFEPLSVEEDERIGKRARASIRGPLRHIEELRRTFVVPIGVAQFQTFLQQITTELDRRVFSGVYHKGGLSVRGYSLEDRYKRVTKMGIEGHYYIPVEGTWVEKLVTFENSLPWAQAWLDDPPILFAITDMGQAPARDIFPTFSDNGPLRVSSECRCFAMAVVYWAILMELGGIWPTCVIDLPILPAWMPAMFPYGRSSLLYRKPQGSEGATQNDTFPSVQESVGKSRPQVKRQAQPGRRRNKIDEWAREQVHSLGRDKADVYLEWLEKGSERVAALSDPKDTFNHLIKSPPKSPPMKK